MGPVGHVQAIRRRLRQHAGGIPTEQSDQRPNDDWGSPEYGLRQERRRELTGKKPRASSLRLNNIQPRWHGNCASGAMDIIAASRPRKTLVEEGTA